MSLGQISKASIERAMEEFSSDQEEDKDPTQRVQAPDRKMLEIEEPTIYVPKEQKLISTQDVSEEQKKEIFVPKSQTSYDQSQTGIGTTRKKETFINERVGVGTEPGAGIESENVGKDVVSFEIEWEGKIRDIISSVRPTYPPGVQEEGNVKIEFWVDPKGNVKPSMSVVIKLNIQLENAAMTALRRWRFKPLAGGQEQVDQRAIITLKFLLK